MPHCHGTRYSQSLIASHSCRRRRMRSARAACHTSCAARVLRATSCATHRAWSSFIDATNSRYPHVHPHLRRVAADWALLHLGRAITACALVAAWHRGVRLGVDEADGARRLATDGRLGNLRTAGVELRVGE
eukprot:scaffold57280_cov61-Phaeocystis_antarctica.AAC.2